jgi:hypothetical protein
LSPILGIIASQNYSRITGSYESIQTVNVGAGGSTSITFSSIPSTYKHLQIRAYAPTGNYMDIRFNGDTTSSNYRGHYIVGVGSGTPGAGTNANAAYFPEAGGWSSPWCAVLDILDYSDTNKYKTQRTLEGFDANGSGEVYLYSSLWMSTSAISSIVLSRSGASVGQYSKFALYGIKG